MRPDACLVEQLQRTAVSVGTLGRQKSPAVWVQHLDRLQRALQTPNQREHSPKHKAFENICGEGKIIKELDCSL